MAQPTTPTVPIGPSTIIAAGTIILAAIAAVYAAVEEKTPESISAAAVALGAVVTLVTSRTSQANTLATVARRPIPVTITQNIEGDGPVDPDRAELDGRDPATFPAVVAEGTE